MFAESGNNCVMMEKESIEDNVKIGSESVPELDDTYPAPDGGWGWLVVLGSFIIHVIIDGIMYSFGVFLPEFVTYFDLGRADVSLLGSLLPGIACLSGPIASALTNKYGCRKVTIAGSFIATFGFFISVFATNIYVLYFSFGILAGIGFSFIFLPAIVSVGHYFEKKRASATGIAVCGSGIGTSIIAPFSNFLIQEYGWKGAILIQAGLILNCAVCGALFRPLESPKQHQLKPIDRNLNSHAQTKRCINTRSKVLPLITSKNGSCRDVDSTQDKKLQCSNLLTISSNAKGDMKIAQAYHHDIQRPMLRKDIFYSGSLTNIPMYTSDHSLYMHSVTSVPKHATKHNVDSFTCHYLSAEMRLVLREMMDLSVLKDMTFVLFVTSNVFKFIGCNTPFVFLTDRAIQAGIDKSSASFLLSVVGIGNTIGRVVFGFMADFKCINRLYLYNIALAICGVMTALNGIFDTYYLLVVYACVFGIFIGTNVVMLSVVLVDLLGLERLTNAFGILLLFQGIGTLIGPPLAGWVFDETRSYQVSFGMAGAMLAVSGLMLFFIPCLQTYVMHKERLSRRDIDFGKRVTGHKVFLEADVVQHSSNKPHISC